MNNQLKVDYGPLEKLSDVLSALQWDLNDKVMTSQVEKYRPYLGSGTVADHLDQVMTNWQKKHEQLINQVNALATAAKKIPETFANTDQSLTSTISPAGQ